MPYMAIKLVELSGVCLRMFEIIVFVLFTSSLHKSLVWDNK